MTHHSGSYESQNKTIRHSDRHVREAAYQEYQAASGAFAQINDEQTAPIDCPTDELAWYANGTLSAQRSAQIAAHLRTCARCQHELLQWRLTGTALQRADAALPLPRASLFGEIEQQLEARTPHARTQAMRAKALHAWQYCRQHGGYIGELFWAQTRLLRLDLLWSPLFLLLIIPFSAALKVYSPSLVLSAQAFFSTLLIALAMAFLPGYTADPTDEMIQATPTTPALILCLRCALIFGYNTLINLLALLPLLLATSGMAFTAQWFIANWLAPLCCLAAISLLLSIVANARVALGACLLLWGLRAITLAPHGLVRISGFLSTYGQFWQQTALLFSITIVAVVSTFILVERKGHISL